MEGGMCFLNQSGPEARLHLSSIASLPACAPLAVEHVRPAVAVNVGVLVGVARLGKASADIGWLLPRLSEALDGGAEVGWTGRRRAGQRAFSRRRPPSATSLCSSVLSVFLGRVLRGATAATTAATDAAVGGAATTRAW
jgi:hypothetical protein